MERSEEDGCEREDEREDGVNGDIEIKKTSKRLKII